MVQCFFLSPSFFHFFVVVFWFSLEKSGLDEGVYLACAWTKDGIHVSLLPILLLAAGYLHQDYSLWVTTHATSRPRPKKLVPVLSLRFTG